MFVNQGATERPARLTLRSSLRNVWWYVRVVVIAVLAVAALVFAVMALQPQSEGHTVLVARLPLDAGHVLAESDLAHATVSAGAKPDDALTDLEAAVGQPLQQELLAKTVLTESHLGAVEVPPGFAALTLTLNQPDQLLAVGEAVEVWGPQPACEDSRCPMVKLCATAYVTGLSSLDGGLTNPDTTVRVSLRLPPPDVGKVLEAANNAALYFVTHSS